MSEAASPRLLKMYQRFVEVSHSLASNLDLESLLNRIMNAAVDLAEAEEASILLYDQHTHQLYFETATNARSNPLIQKLVVPEESIAGWVALHRTAQIVNNVEQDNRHFDNIDKQLSFNSRSIIAIPLVFKQKLIGVLEVLNKKTGFFDQADQEILTALADQAAIAIENSRLFQQSDLIAEFVHELRTPLSSILTASYLLQRPEIAGDQRQAMAQTIQSETQRLNDLATIFLDMASLESGRAVLRASRFALLPLLEECIQVTQAKATEQEIQIYLETSGALPELTADRDKIKQVLLNLLNNAIKYNRAGGQVWLKAGAEMSQVWISIQDTGVGIPPGQISQLFTRFFRASNVAETVSGTGLGLAISKRIVDLHEGKVQVTSELGKGTTITVRLPLTNRQAGSLT